MKLPPFAKSTRRRDLDAVLAAYSCWRAECAAVRTAYRAWAHAVPADASLAFACYRKAIDREERAADIYARGVRRLRRLPDLGPARQVHDCLISTGTEW